MPTPSTFPEFDLSPEEKQRLMDYIHDKSVPKKDTALHTEIEQYRLLKKALGQTVTEMINTYKSLTLLAPIPAEQPLELRHLEQSQQRLNQQRELNDKDLTLVRTLFDAYQKLSKVAQTLLNYPRLLQPRSSPGPTSSTPKL